MLAEPCHARSWRVVRLAALIFTLATTIATVTAADTGPRVALLRVNGAITPAMATYIGRGIADAGDRGDAAVILEMDTPGGLSSAMDDIIGNILRANLPVIVYVAPDGARAASAGTYIAYAAQIAAMAPTTNIGSATPINLGGSGNGLSTSERKVINDAAAKIRGLAERRGRNADWAEQAVRDAANVTASQAVELGVVDFMAVDRAELLAKADGRVVEVNGQQVTVRTAGAQIETFGMSFFERFLQTLSDPNIAYLLISLGGLALVFELANPGLIVPGVIGGLMLVTGFYALGTLDSNWSGLALIAFAMLLFTAEVFVTSHGVLSVGGVAAFLFGSLLLANSRNGEVLRLSRSLVLAVTLGLATFFGAIVYFAARVRDKPPVSGASTLIGATGVVRSDLNLTGMVFLNGELWEATSTVGSIPRGERVIVTGVRGIRLDVAPLMNAAADAVAQGQP